MSRRVLVLLAALVCVSAPRAFAQAPSFAPEFQVNTYTSVNQYFPKVAADAAGNFVVVWESNLSNQDGSQGGIFAQRYDANGAPPGRGIPGECVHDEQPGPPERGYGSRRRLRRRLAKQCPGRVRPGGLRPALRRRRRRPGKRVPGQHADHGEPVRAECRDGFHGQLRRGMAELSGRLRATASTRSASTAAASSRGATSLVEHVHDRISEQPERRHGSRGGLRGGVGRRGPGARRGRRRLQRHRGAALQQRRRRAGRRDRARLLRRESPERRGRFGGEFRRRLGDPVSSRTSTRSASTTPATRRAACSRSTALRSTGAPRRASRSTRCGKLHRRLEELGQYLRAALRRRRIPGRL